MRRSGGSADRSRYTVAPWACASRQTGAGPTMCGFARCGLVSWMRRASRRAPVPIASTWRRLATYARRAPPVDHGASVALRKLVDEARKLHAGRDRVRRAQEVSYRFMSALAGDLPGFEDAIRALFTGDPARFDEHTRAWPRDVRTYARQLAAPALGER